MWRHSGVTETGMRRQVSHLQPQKIANASVHMTAQRGQEGGASTTTATGKTASGNQPCHQGTVGAAREADATWAGEDRVSGGAECAIRHLHRRTVGARRQPAKLG